MASAHDVAEYILAKRGPMTAMKLQKLVYYAQAWHLTWSDSPLFTEAIEAWANGPVVPSLYAVHRGRFQLEKGTFQGGDPSRLTLDEADSVDRVLAAYGSKSSQWLSDLTHAEAPWRDARSGIADGERGAQPIEHSAMVEYYSSL